MNEIVKHEPQGVDLATQMRFAEVITSPQGQSILPKAYQGNPANALIAINLGSAMGLAPAEALYRIDVIQGTPTASAELVASNVRKAGHKLRVITDEAKQSVTAQIIRADDPDYTYEVTRDMAWAQQMGLAGKDNYKKQPLTMLQWRAITAVARLAASEALYGVAYTADEVREGSTPNSAPKATASDFTSKAPSAPEITSNKGVSAGHAEAPTEAQTRKMWASLNERIAPEMQRAFMAETVGREFESSKDLTRDEVSAIINRLENM